MLSPCVGTRHEDYAGAPTSAWRQHIAGQAWAVLSSILLPVLRGFRCPLLSLLLSLHTTRCFMQILRHKLHTGKQATSTWLTHRLVTTPAQACYFKAKQQRWKALPLQSSC